MCNFYFVGRVWLTMHVWESMLVAGGDYLDINFRKIKF